MSKPTKREILWDLAVFVVFLVLLVLLLAAATRNAHGAELILVDPSGEECIAEIDVSSPLVHTQDGDLEQRVLTLPDCDPGDPGDGCAPSTAYESVPAAIDRFTGGRFATQCDPCLSFEEAFGFLGNIRQGTYRIPRLCEGCLISLPLVIPESGGVQIVSDETPESADSTFAVVSRCAAGIEQPVDAGVTCAVGGGRSWAMTIGADEGLFLCAPLPGDGYHLIIGNPGPAGEVLLSVRPR